MKKSQSKNLKKSVQEPKSDENIQMKDSNAVHEGVKYRVNFLVGQFFRGDYYNEGDSIELPEGDAKAYAQRSTLRIEPL